MEDNGIDIQIQSQALDAKANQKYVTDESCGAINLFIGTVRRWNKNEEITHLEFECYESMAISELNKIAMKAKDLFAAIKISIHHRIGKVGVKDIAVVIAVSCIHRKEAFQACEFIIGELKKTVPIWKKEFKLDGSYWVNSRP